MNEQFFNSLSEVMKYGQDVVGLDGHYKAFAGALHNQKWDQLPRLAETLAGASPTQPFITDFHLRHLPTLLRAAKTGGQPVRQAMESLRKSFRLPDHLFPSKHASGEQAIRYGLEDHASFQNKIHENVQEEVPHLVYADWLEENGKPAHAAFIRRVVEGMRDRHERLVNGQWYGSYFTTAAEPHADTLFTSHGWHSDGKSNVDLSSQLSVNGKRVVWGVGGLDPEEARQLRDALASEGATARPISGDKNDPLDKSYNPHDHFSAISKALKYGADYTHEDFQNKINENPLNAGAHLAYSDWLREQGHEHEADFRKSLGEWFQKDNFNSGTNLHSEPDSVGDFWAIDPTDLPEGIQGTRLAQHADHVSGTTGRLLWHKYADMEEGMRKAFHSGRENATQEADHFRTISKALKYSLASHEEFHNAIHEQPNDATNALVYADWLQENGHEAQAELVRLHANNEGTGGYSLLNPHKSPNRPTEPNGRTTYVTNHMEASGPSTHSTSGKKIVEMEHRSPTGDRLIRWSSGPMSSEDASQLHARLVGEGAQPVPDQWLLDTTDLFCSSDRPVKYAAVPQHEYHPDYAPNGVAPQLGHWLSEIAGQNSDAGAMAEGILRTGDHSLLPYLADKLADDGHPLRSPADGSDGPDWRHAHRAIKIDKVVAGVLANSGGEVVNPTFGTIGLAPLSPAVVMVNWIDKRRPGVSRLRMKATVKKVVPDVNKDDLHHSLVRLSNNLHAQGSNGKPPPASLTAIYNIRLKNLGTEIVNAHLYPDTRPTGKQVYTASKYTVEEEKGFHKTISENPNDATAALVYADWLQENGREPQADFLRTSVEQHGTDAYGATTRLKHEGEDPSPESVFATQGRDHIRLWYGQTGKHDPKTAISWMVKAGDYEQARKILQGLHENGVTVLGSLGRQLLALDHDKYVAWKSPAGGMVVKEHPLQVAGTFVEGGKFTTNLEKLATPTTTVQPTKKLTLQELLKKVRAKR